MSSGDGTEGFHAVGIVDAQRYPEGGAVLANRVVVRSSRAGATVDDAAGHGQLIGPVRVGAAGSDPRPRANQLPYLDPFLPRPSDRCFPSLRGRLAP